MAKQNNAPSGLDLSNCITSSDGGNTTFTIADMCKTVNDTNAQISNINKNVSQTNSDMATLKNDYNVDNLLLKSNVGKAGEAVIWSKDAQQLVIPSNSTESRACLMMGWKLDENGNTMVDPVCQETNIQAVITHGNATPMTIIHNWFDPSYNLPSLAFQWFGSIHSNDDGEVDLGNSSHAWKNCYLKNSPQITSDINDKTVVAKADDNSDNSKNLLKAIYGLTASTYRMNQAIAEKGDDKARIHSGYIAQEVEKALRDNALDPADFALWTQDVKWVSDDVDTGKKDPSGKPVIVKKMKEEKDAQGNLIYHQKLRYEEIFCLMLEAHKQEIEAFKQKISSLEARLTALESK